MPFPSTSVLDSFTRADGAPGANWSTPITVGWLPMTIVSNALSEDSAGFGFDSHYWSASTFGPDCEAYAKIATKGSNNAMVMARIQSPNSVDVDAYVVRADSFDTKIRKLVNDVYSDLGAAIATVIPAGDSFGISCVGTTIEAWHKPAAGPWTLLGSRTDSDISGAGFIGLHTDSTNKGWSFDDFGGGSIMAGGPADAVAFARAGRGAGW